MPAGAEPRRAAAGRFPPAEVDADAATGRRPQGDLRHRPKLEKVLNGLGVWTYAQIAAWTREEIAWVDDYLSFRGRIGRDDWIGQAVKLSGTKTKR